MRAFSSILLISAVASIIAVACGGSSSTVSGGASPADGGTGSTELAGQTCALASDCYPGLDAGTLLGAVQCLSKVPNGYCTHLCTKDSDCCAVSGECKTGIKQVCSPFESTGQMMCFLSCESADVSAGIATGSASGGYDGGTTEAGSVEDAYCQSYASAAFTCRSTGGGKNNRKVCSP
jgi:hypothetical protein